MELENERPCVFKSISPVCPQSDSARDQGRKVGSLMARIPGMEQCEPYTTSGKDTESTGLVRDSYSSSLVHSDIRSAHVRASTMAGARKSLGKGSQTWVTKTECIIASEDNCHPWIFDRLMVSSGIACSLGYDPLTLLQFMHNGEVRAGCPPREAYADRCQINQFHKIKRKLQQSLPEELFLYPTGYTGWSWPCTCHSGSNSRCRL